jgi:hypothetical protein
MNKSIEKALQANHQTLIMIAWIYKAQLSFLLDEWAKAESVFKDIMQLSGGF